MNQALIDRLHDLVRKYQIAGNHEEFIRELMELFIEFKTC